MGKNLHLKHLWFSGIEKVIYFIWSDPDAKVMDNAIVFDLNMAFIWMVRSKEMIR